MKCCILKVIFQPVFFLFSFMVRSVLLLIKCIFKDALRDSSSSQIFFLSPFSQNEIRTPVFTYPGPYGSAAIIPSQVSVWGSIFLLRRLPDPTINSLASYNYFSYIDHVWRAPCDTRVFFWIVFSSLFLLNSIQNLWHFWQCIFLHSLNSIYKKASGFFSLGDWSLHCMFKWIR